MKLPFGILVAATLPMGAQAQSAITTTPLMPPSVQYPPPAAAPPPASQPQTATQGSQQVPPPAPSAPQPMQLTWLPQANATLQVLDKVNAQSSVLTVKVGQQAQFGSLTIQVQACDSHPLDQPQDSAAYLTITDSRADASGFRGWMLANNPSVSMLQHPIYDVRVVACRA
jgi:hypothetical protein